MKRLRYNWFQVKINHDYFSLNTPFENAVSFMRAGHLYSHCLDRLKWHYCPRYFIVPSFPTHIDIEASSLCQMRCPMCKTAQMLNEGIGSFGHMDFGLFKEIIDQCSTQPLFSIKLSWRGEPLLNPFIVDMVAYAKSKSIKDIAFLTNAERLNPKLTEDLVRAGLDWISISFDGMREIYNQIRKPAVFEDIIEKIKYIRKYREKIKSKKPLIRIQTVHSAIRGSEGEFLRLWEGIADKVNFIADQKRSLNSNDYTHDPAYICPSAWQRMCIAWDGKVVQCYGDYQEGNILGNVRQKSIKEIWHDTPFQELRRLIKNCQRLATKPCRTCSDGGITEEEEISIGGRKIKAVHYVHQGVDVKTMVTSQKETQ